MLRAVPALPVRRPGSLLR